MALLEIRQDAIGEQLQRLDNVLVLVSAGLDEDVPIFARGGSIVPTAADRFTLLVFADGDGNADGDSNANGDADSDEHAD